MKLIYTILIVFCLSLNCKAQKFVQITDTKGKIDAVAINQVIEEIDKSKIDKLFNGLNFKNNSFDAELKLMYPKKYDVYFSTDGYGLWIATGTSQCGFIVK